MTERLAAGARRVTHCIGFAHLAHSTPLGTLPRLGTES
jgi:hypothetical protein